MAQDVTSKAKDTRNHRWRFFRAGGFDQVRLETGDDLLGLADLDQKLWVALSCPVQGLEFDQKTLELIDTDKDGRVRAPEILAAVKWACSVLKNPATLLEESAALKLSAINAEVDEGKRLLSSAKEILSNLGKKGDKEITLEETADTARIFAQTRFNGDGIVPVTSAESEALQQTLKDVIDCVGSEVDRSGLPGVSQQKVDAFFTAATAFADWWGAAELDAANVLPLGEATHAAAAALRAVKGKVDDYFTRAHLIAFDARAAGPLNRDEAEYTAIAAKELSLGATEVLAFPLSHVEANKPLGLDTGLNPAWTTAVRELREKVVTPILGERSALTDQDWGELARRLGPYEAWRAKDPQVPVAKLGIARVREIVASGAKAAIEELIAKDKELEPEANAIASVDKLLRYKRDLATLLNNFVTFRDFYSRKKKALFQAGTLYLDGRSCELCIKVNDAAAHAVVAHASGTYLAYCDVVRKGTGEKMVIAAAFTGGDSDALAVGRNGIFYDRKGNDWDANIIKIIDHPISVRQAFWMPYKRVAKLIGDQIEKFAAARDKDVHEHAAANVADASKTMEKAPADVAAAAAPAPAAAAAPAAAPHTAAEQAFDVGKFAGIFAAIGLAVGAIGSAFAAVATGFLRLEWWQMPLVVVGAVLAVSGPSMLIAWLKLRQRNLGPILDANGWAVNARAKVNIPFGASLTAVAELPPNAERSLDDPFAEKRVPWLRWVVLAIVVGGLLLGFRLGANKTWITALLPKPPASAAPAASGSAVAPPASAAPAAPK
jgi:hypothetical protein